MITYSSFIKELENLVVEAKEIRNAKDMHQNKTFRNWRLNLEAALNQIVQLGYLLPTPIKIQSRRFGYYPGRHESEEIFHDFQMEMDDTINELALIINNYKNHGAPPKSEQRKENASNAIENITSFKNKSNLKEKIENNLTLWLLGVMFTGFGAGLGVYQGILEIAHLEVLSKQEINELKSKPNKLVTEARILTPSIAEQIDKLTSSHLQRLAELQKQLLLEEKQSSNDVSPDSWKKSHKESAQRIRDLISEEHQSYNNNIRGLESF